MKRISFTYPGYVLFVLVCLILGVALHSKFSAVSEKLSALQTTVRSQEVAIGSLEKQIPAIAEYMLVVKSLQEACGGKLTPFQIVEIARIIVEQCYMNQDIGLRPSLILAIMERESHFDPEAVSSARAYGIMQIVRTTFDVHLLQSGYGGFSKDLAFNPIINTEIGIKELVRLRKYWLEEGLDSWMIAINSYFWGTSATWELFINERRAELPSLEYGKGVLDLAKTWQEKGIG